MAGMQKIRVQLENNGYDIVVGSGIILELPELIKPLVKPSHVLIVTNPSIDRLYGETVREALKPLQCEALTEAIPEGESHKNMTTVEKLLDRMVEARLDRASLIVSLGGGVVGDIAGFTAAIFMRGIPYIQVPTTLLAQVDSSIGGKVGVDHAHGKNLIGAFYQPILVCADTEVLASLSESHIRNGIAEIIKYGVVADEGLFALIERQPQLLLELENNGLLTDVIKRCCQIKARIVQQDMRETTGLRSLLNYGHTIGHAVEAATGYRRFSHGEAVSIGMVAAAKIARLMKLMPEEVEKRQENLLSAVGLPTKLSGVEKRAIIEATRLDKKATAGKNRFIVPMAIGRVVVKDGVPLEIIEQALDEIGAA